MQYMLRVQDKKEKIKIIHDLADNFLFKVTNSTFSYRDRLPGANCGLARIFPRRSNLSLHTERQAM